MKNTCILLLTLMSIVFCGAVYASDGEGLTDRSDVDINAETGFEAYLENAEINHSDAEVSELITSIDRKGNPAQWNGMRVKLPNKATIWVMEGGKRRAIPNPATYNNLFNNWKGIYSSIYVSQLPIGKPIPSHAVLFKGTSKTVWITDHREKRPITGTAFKKYYFNWGRVIRVPNAVINTIPRGRTWK